MRHTLTVINKVGDKFYVADLIASLPGLSRDNLKTEPLRLFCPMRDGLTIKIMSSLKR